MSCKSALDKLSSNQLKHCLNLGSIMSSFKSPSSQAVYQFNRGKKDVEHKGRCQVCSKYKPRARVHLINKKKAYNEKQKGKFSNSDF